jgi:excisionase family DNA binding protein
MTLRTVKEAAKLLRVSPATVYALVANGTLPACRVGVGRGVIRIRDEDLQRFAAPANGNAKATEAATERVGVP